MKNQKKGGSLAVALLPALLWGQFALAQEPAPPKKAGAKPKATPSAPPASAAAAKPPEGGMSSLPPVVVTSQAAKPQVDDDRQEYGARQSSMALKTDTPLIETPMAVNIVPRAVMDDQQNITLRDIVQNVSGVQWSPVEGELYDNFIVRGFDANSSISRNGVREQSLATDMANLERVEVLKGTAAMLYGRSEPGGLINRVTKAPLWTPYYSAQQQFGSFNTYRTTLDATGPINGELAYRTVFAYQNKESYRDFVNNERFFFSPSITWKPTERTEIGLQFEYMHDNGRWDDGIPAAAPFGSRPVNVPYTRYLGDPVSNDKQEREVIDLHWSHAFTDNWKMNQRFVASLVHYDQFNVFPWSLYTDGSMNLGLWYSTADRDSYSQNINLEGHFDGWGDSKHTFLAGLDFYIYDQPGKTANPTVGPLADGTAMQNLYHPVYGQFDANLLRATPWNSYGYRHQEWYGAYLQDQIKVLDDKLQFLLGGRYDWTQYGQKFGAQSSAAAEDAVNDNTIYYNKFNPRFGILYQPVPWVSIYGNYSQSLGTNNGVNADGIPIKPQEGEGYEAGVKGEFFNGQLTTTLAYFYLDKTNIAVGSPNPVLAKQGIMETIGAARSQGIEIDVAGRIDENWSLIANYAWTDSRITQDGPQTLYDDTWSTVATLPRGFVGNRLPLAPVQSANLWAKYEFTDPTFKGLSFGSGLRVASQAQGDPANDFQIPGYVTWNMMVSYKRNIGKNVLTAQLNANNILNHQYYYGVDQVDGSQRFNIIPAAPVNLMGTVKWEYY